MSSTPTGRYAKGVARRAEILQAAMDAYATSDRSGPRLRDIAASVGLTEAGVLHYFDSKDRLFVAILRARDEAAASQHDLYAESGLWEYLEETVSTPGLAKLFADMAVAAADPEHPAHAFLREHDAAAAEVVRRDLGLKDPTRVMLVLAAAEGLQLRWLRDPSTDLIGALRELARLLR